MREEQYPTLYFGERDDLLDEFEAFYQEREGADYNFNRLVKEGMALKMAVDETMDKLGYDLDARGKRIEVRRSLTDSYRREGDG